MSHFYSPPFIFHRPRYTTLLPCSPAGPLWKVARHQDLPLHNFWSSVKEPPPGSFHTAPVVRDVPLPEPSFNHLSEFPVNGPPPPCVPTGALWREVTVSRAVFHTCPSRRAPCQASERGPHGERCLSPVSPNVAPRREMPVPCAPTRGPHGERCLSPVPRNVAPTERDTRPLCPHTWPHGERCLSPVPRNVAPTERDVRPLCPFPISVRLVPTAVIILS
jgi:hypothetical protein